VKIYVAAMELLMKKERHDDPQFTTKIDGFPSFIHCRMVMYFYAGLKKNLALCMTKLRVLALCFSYILDNSIV
jgi:hypothetical protein